MGWHAKLTLDYQREGLKTVARHTHSGPLRILQSLYPQGDAICHNVLVHPPGGLVGGDTLEMHVHAHSGTHGLITTPGATRFYRSEGEVATQCTTLSLEPGARLEWLPQEAICYSGCRARNALTLNLQPGAELLGWDVVALGLPLANQPFIQGRLEQRIEMPGIWLEAGVMDASDTRLLDGATGLAAQRCVATAFFVSGAPLRRDRRQMALDSARVSIQDHPLAPWTGITSPDPQVIVARVLAPVTEPAMDILRAVRNAWWQSMWGQMAVPPRIWSM